ncbi:hypothetical protein QBC35DRAFT_93547 [Podospora australis]|uniref:Uncharacterized protein n=1 Tax=Podospora australis TaxID=1536484 RepID=A0AAN6X111_9PEZI|nr:hypothetical protein QBC35DRAFT_93547 [Podospora australis]
MGIVALLSLSLSALCASLLHSPQPRIIELLGLTRFQSHLHQLCMLFGGWCVSPHPYDVTLPAGQLEEGGISTHTGELLLLCTNGRSAEGWRCCCCCCSPFQPLSCAVYVRVSASLCLPHTSFSWLYDVWTSSGSLGVTRKLQDLSPKFQYPHDWVNWDLSFVDVGLGVCIYCKVLASTCGAIVQSERCPYLEQLGVWHMCGSECGQKQQATSSKSGVMWRGLRCVVHDDGAGPGFFSPNPLAAGSS